MPTLDPIPVRKRPRGRPRKNPVAQSEVFNPIPREGELVEQKPLAEVNKPTVDPGVNMMVPPGPAPPGWKWVFNRLAGQFDAEFDSKPWIFKAHEFRQVPVELAHHLVNWSIIQLPTTGPPVRALALEGKKGFGMPFKATARPQEMVDRSTEGPQRHGGIPTAPKLVYIGGKPIE